MNIVRQNQIKAKIAKITSHNVSKINKLIIIQKSNSISKKNKILHYSINNNNSISSVKATDNTHNNSKKNLFNKQIPIIQPKISLKHYNLVEKMYLYRKKNETKNCPINLISRKSNNNQNSIYNINNIINANNHIKINESSNISKNNNISINNKANHFIKRHIINPKYTNDNTYIIQNNLKITDVVKNKYNYNNINNNSNKTSNLINIFNIHTLNTTDKDYLGKRISVSNPQKLAKKEHNKDYKKEINTLLKEKDERQNTIKKQKKLIEKLEEDNQKLEKEIQKIDNENNKIKKKIELSQENQEQLIVLVKIIQKSGVDIEELIDKWNDEVDKDNENKKTEKNNNDKNESLVESNYELSSNIDSSSFIPINIEKPHINKRIYDGIPKLNFDILKTNNNNNNNNKEKYRNKSK